MQGIGHLIHRLSNHTASTTHAAHSSHSTVVSVSVMGFAEEVFSCVALNHARSHVRIKLAHIRVGTKYEVLKWIYLR